jgi:hypothetical protein
MMVDMRLTSRSEPGPEPEPGPSTDDDHDAGITGLLRYRRLVIRVLLVLFLLLPAVSLFFSHQKAGHPAFLIAATLAFVALTDRTVLFRRAKPGQYARWQWLLLPVLVALGAALFAVGGAANPLTVTAAPRPGTAGRPGTVRNHLSAAIQKLGARNRAEAVQIAERKGWL